MSVTLYPGLLQHCGIQHGGSIHCGNTEPVFAIVDPDDEYEVEDEDKPNDDRNNAPIENISRPCPKCETADYSTDSAAARIKQKRTKSRK